MESFYSSLICTGALLFRIVSADTTLFNGAQSIVFEDASPGCLAAFDNSLACDDRVQLLGGYDLDTLEFDQEALSSLCTSDCRDSFLALESAVSSACNDYDIDFNGGYISATEVVDLFAYKYNMSCLADSSGNFCAIVEESWDIDLLNASGRATWPTHTDKLYPDFSEGSDGEPRQDVDGTYIDQSDDPIQWPDWAAELELENSGTDYFLEPISPDWKGHGHDGPLEYDEYPLEIQCSECFLARYKLGIESLWGEVYDEVADQVWNNIRLNCFPSWTLMPANNQSTWSHTGATLDWLQNKTCDQMIEYQSDQETTADALALANSVSSAAMFHLNLMRAYYVESGPYCAPLPCQVAVIGSENPTSANNFVQDHGNMSLTQFWAWNKYMNSKNLRPGEVVCVGPPGGDYTPVSVPQAVPSVYTTTAIPPAPTVFGTSKSCGRYYEVKSGDACADISVANSITLSEFMSMNQQLNSECTNLLSGYAYCVALVNGTSAEGTTGGTSTSPSVVTPTPVQEGMAKNCNEFYKVQSGDGCYAIATEYGISLDDFYAYNPAVGNDCSKLYPDNFVCVGLMESCSIEVTFKTTHSTQWGESVWVVGSWQSWDVNNAFMLTGSSGENGATNWEGTTSLLAGSQFSYKFIKLQTDGTPVWESDPNRIFDTPGCGSAGVQEGGQWHDGTPTCTTVDVLFEVTARTAFGEAMYVIGDAPSLGSWATAAAVQLNADDYTEDNPLWKGSVSLATGTYVQYKFIRIGTDGSFTWEADPNRQFTVPTDCTASPLQSGAW